MMFVPARASKSGSRSGSFTALVATVILPFFSGSSAAFAENLFLRGDVNANDRIEVTDSVLILRQLFQGDEDALTCDDATDVDDNGKVDITDGIQGLTYLFLSGDPPRYPYTHCGADESDDQLWHVRSRSSVR